MRRIDLRLLMLAMSLLASGCSSLGWYRAVGHFPAVAQSDYAFYEYCGVSSQVFQFSAPQVQSAAVEALRDLGFRDFELPKKSPDGSVEMRLHAQDGRDVTVTFSPQNSMTNMRFTVGPLHAGDEILAREVFRRVSLNFGTLPRTYMPLEPVLARRQNPPSELPPAIPGPPPETLEGEGLRPGDEAGRPSLEYTAPVTGFGSGLIPQPFDPYRASNSGINYPAYPYEPFQSPYFQQPIPMFPANP